MNVIVVRLLLVVSSCLATIWTATYFGIFYKYLFPYISGGSFIGSQDACNWIIGYPLGLVFLLTFLMHVQGEKNVWWWIGVALIPAVLFEVLFDPLHLYVPIALGLLGWGLGYLANKTLWKLAPGMMAKLG